MTQADSPLSQDAAWAAFHARDRAADGRVVVGVLTTGIYCRPSCPARPPKPENVRLFRTTQEARAAGLRACLRCRPDEVAPDAAAVARAIALIEASDTVPTLDALAAAAGLSPHHFHRLFRRATGVTPAAFARSRRASRAEAALDEAQSITGAIFDAGYDSASRFYADSGDRLGMTPSAWRDGGRGATIDWAVATTSLGPLLVAATARGLCRVAFGEDEAALRARFPNAALVSGNADFAALVDSVVAQVENPGPDPRLPMDVRGTAFQEAVWRELRAIPPGETRSYAALAAAVGRPGAVRAAGSACGANHLAVIIPCHRVRRSDGSLGGYAYGLDRKQALLAREESGG
jgi:AraC family transcriptional regulator of adaptative response/methylated-DNA-[protein]-cysteine methyltransferase